MPATVWKGSLSFGLVAFPVRLLAAARPAPVRFHMLHAKDMSRVKEVWYCAEEDKPIERSEMVRGYETSKNKYVALDDESLKKIAYTASRTMEVTQFVSAAEVDPILFERSYYVAPESDSTKPYALFMAALEKTEKCAIAKIAMHSREHVVLIRPSGQSLVLHTLYYENEMNSSHRTAGSRAKYTAKELELAKRLVASLDGPFRHAAYRDNYRKNVQHLIAQKSKSQTEAAEKETRKAPVIDLMEALKLSLAKNKKTAPKESRSRRNAA